MEEDFKRCAFCNQTLQIDKFGSNKARPDGLNTYCKKCSRIYGRRLAWAYRYEVLSHYSGDPPKCECCGESQLEFLALDHIDGGGKKHIEEIGFKLANWLRKNGFPGGFRVLCHNCNFAIGHYGYCPHKETSKVEIEVKKFHDNLRGRGGIRRNKLSEDQVSEIKSRLLNGETCRGIAKDFSIDESVISKIKVGRAWKHVKPNDRGRS